MCKVLVMQRNKIISHLLIHKIPKIEDKTLNFKKKSGKNRNPITKTTKKKRLTELLINEKMVVLLLVFLKDKKVGSKKYMAEKEIE